ncbi:thiamine diphosphokinase [uncultured Sphaerochaeta sp.]|uniref:thiamine diphosphokinase n=1 Tax=uncultured Sphaerochaeta sp. TaxID=886478 RepID=UPI002A0A968D|nr:thiamine diphosphokinase [uncultured Sphaerochaeta sp.]
MSKSIIFTGAEPPKALPQDLYEPGDFVIAADSGYDSARKLGFKVDLAIGDFDSTALFEEIKKIGFEQHDRDKDESDTCLALQRATELTGNSYVLIGGGGGRLDHLFATYSLFDQFGPPLRWYTAKEICYLVSDCQRFDDLESGMTVSFFPAKLTGSSMVQACQLRWPLQNYELSFNSISLSNRTTGKTLDVSTQGGDIFVSFPVADGGIKMIP